MVVRQSLVTSTALAQVGFDADENAKLFSLPERELELVETADEEVVAAARFGQVALRRG
jgi:hypothetical protein